jgi:ankyrin repeat protein
LRSFSGKKLNDALIWFLSRRVDWTAEFLELGADCDVYSSNYPHTPLQAAILDKHFSVITFLLEKNAKLQIERTIVVKQALHTATTIGSVDVITALLDAGAEIDIQDEFGFTPLHYAVLNGHLRAVEVLLQRGANKNIKFFYFNDLCLKFKHLSEPKKLFLANEMTPFEIAVVFDYFDIAKVLMKDLSKEELYDYLEYSIAQKHIGIFRELVNSYKNNTDFPPESKLFYGQPSNNHEIILCYTFEKCLGGI